MNPAARRQALVEAREAAGGGSGGSRKGRTRRPRRPPGEAYSTDSYRRAITRACKAAGVTRWTPHQLRHSAAKRLAAEEDLDAVRALLGHSDLRTTLGYAHADEAKATKLASRTG